MCKNEFDAGTEDRSILHVECNSMLFTLGPYEEDRNGMKINVKTSVDKRATQKTMIIVVNLYSQVFDKAVLICWIRV